MGRSRKVADGVDGVRRAIAALLTDAEPGLQAHFTFPDRHRRQIRSTNPLERLNTAIKRRSAVVGIRWQDGRRPFSPETMAAIDAVTMIEEVGQPLLMAS